VGQAALAQFDDAPKMDSWVYQSFKLVYDAGLIKGYPDGTFKGSRPATRNEVVEFMARLMNYFEQKLAGQAPVKTVSNTQCLSEEDCKALIAEALAEQDESASQEEVSMLSDDVFDAIQDLEEQFRDELDALDVRVTTLEQKVAALEESDKKQDETIAKLQEDLAKSAQDNASAQEEAKKAKTFGLIGIILAVLGAVI